MDSNQLSVTSEDRPQKDKKESKGKSEALENPSSLRDTPHSQGESLENPKQDASATLKTRGIRPPRGTQVQVLQGLAKKAAHSNSRNDVHEYMRIRRNFV